MDITGILVATVLVGAVGLFVGLFLGVAGIKFKVEVDEREEAILGVLPGNNCGGCGYAGCSGLAAAIVKGEAPANACPVGGEKVGSQVAQIMGVEAGESVRKVAFVKCQGDKERPFDAIHVINGVAVVDKEACKACGKCVAVCPKHLIELIPYDAKHVVACSSREKGPDTMKACDVGCIACQLCKRNCPADAVTIEDFHAIIDQDKCTGCGTCKEKCPKKAIV